MIPHTADDLVYLTFDIFSGVPDIRHFVSTRKGGTSPPPFDTLNMGFGTCDDPRNVLENRRRLASAVGVPLENFVVGRQVHGSTVRIIAGKQRGRGSASYEDALDATDALVTDVPGLCLMVLLADCTPVLFHDPKRRVVAAAHAGWKGTVSLIGQKVVETMVSHYGSSPGDILAGIGSSIGPCHYQVGPEVIAQVDSAFGSRDGLVDRETSDGHGYLNLWEANRRQLLDAGIPGRNIEVAEICTYCNADLFFSERFTRGTGRFGVGIMLETADAQGNSHRDSH